MQRPLILICNDDGYEAKGINSLVEMLRGLGDIIVCAPDGPRSGYSRAFSTCPLSLTLRRREAFDDGSTLEVWSSSGTPVDCMKIAYARLCPRKADIVLSGINHGDNASTNAHYSGTVGVVVEGALKGIPSIAFSLCDYSADADFQPMTDLVRDMVQDVLNKGMSHYTALNVNVPKEWNGETRWGRMAPGHWRNEVEEGTHPDTGEPCFWMKGYYQNDEPDAQDTDAWAIAHGIASITPITAELTDYEVLSHCR